MISTVKDQVLAHYGQTDQTEISTGGRMRRSADIDAGETGAEVSAKALKSIAGQKRDMIKYDCFCFLLLKAGPWWPSLVELDS